jgi:hypothetical protein
MGYRSRVAAVTLMMAALAGGYATAPASAQAREPDPPSVAPQTAGGSDTDVFDVARRLLHKTPPDPAQAKAWDYRKRMLAILPTFGYKPSSGFTIGASGSLTKYLGNPNTTRISSAVMGVSLSSKNQTSLTARFGASGRNDRWRLDGDNRFQWTSQDSYGLGTGTTPEDAVNTKFDFFRVYNTAFYELTDSVYAGVGFHYSTHTNIRPGSGAEATWADSDFVSYSQKYGFDLNSQSSSSVSLNLMLDTRDNAINASRGWMASAAYRPFFKNVFGSDSAWQEVYLDVRNYVKLKKDGRQRLAFWVYGDLVVSGVAPYFDLPALGMDAYGRTGRGYVEGRYRGEELLYGEIEYRATLTRNGLLGMVAFANTTTLGSHETGEKLFDSFVPGAGIGLRVLFNKRSRTNLCIDFGRGRHGSKGVYLGLQEAF